uniref:RdRp n=1 Tax=Shuangao partiti-like virus 1 TaxID=1923472 RepID=A0A1L3KLM7_9VIRU|nr:RdRp [Shuangao partiti-like virus 1]
MIHLNDVFQEDLDIWSKSPGLPWKELGYKTKGDVRNDPHAVTQIRKFWHFVKEGRKVSPPDCLAYVRAHTAPIGEIKVRAVWGYPATMTFGEAVFALPLIYAYQKRDGPIAYGYETATGGMKKITKRFGHHENFTGLDFSKFDKMTPTWLINIAFDILMLNINFVNYRDYGVADARRTLRMFEFIKDYFVKTTIRMANGARFRKTSGIASGSYFTQLVGSVCNHILCTWMNLHQFGRPPLDILVLGDDSIFATSKPFDLNAGGDLAKEIGMKLNGIKSQTTTSLMTLKFLGYRIGKGTPSKDHDEWLTALLYPEMPDKSFDCLQSRALGLYYANMCVDRRFSQICLDIIKSRPFDLILPRDFERRLKYIGIAIDVIEKGELPSETEFALKMI